MRMKLVMAMVIVLGLGTAAFGQLLNGSFEGLTVYGWATFYGGSTDIPHWTVGPIGSVDLKTTYWEASHGDASIDLSGNSAGSISQTFTTVPGVLYEVTFDMSGNPDSGGREYFMEVEATGNAAGTYSYDSGEKGNTHTDMKWETMTYTFVATSTSTTLTFSDITPPIAPFWHGPVIDYVRLSTPNTVCHRNKSKDGRNSFKTMSFTDPAAVEAHIGHGDEPGPCPES